MLLKDKLEDNFKVNLQLFAGEVDPEPQPNPEPNPEPSPNPEPQNFVTKEGLEGFGRGLIEQLKGLIPQAPEPKPNPEPTPEPPKNEDMPEWAVKLNERLDGIESVNKQQINHQLEDKKAQAIKDYGFEADDLKDIKDEVTLNIVINTAKKVEKQVEQKLPEILKAKGQQIVDLNKVNDIQKVKFGKKEVTPAQAFAGILGINKK